MSPCTSPITQLDAGETEALAIIEKDPDSMLLTDDASVRLVAEQIAWPQGSVLFPNPSPITHNLSPIT